ncbi:hypothetical protein V8D89_004752 [Ganoderma adspersum]
MAAPLDSEETPCYPRTTDSVNNGTGKITLQHYRRQSTIDLANRSVRANSVEEFLNGLLPFRPGRNSNLQRPTLDTNPFQDLKDADTLVEAEVVELFVDAVNSYSLIPGLVMARCENRADPKKLDDKGQKIDAAFFHAKDAPDDGCPHWADQAGSAEFKNGKTGDAKDPWSDIEGNPEPESDDRTKNRGQAMTFAELVCAMQQRVFLFMLYVIGRRFRLLRWDRAGVIFSPLVDYFEDPEPLLEFLWRLSHLGDTALGMDPSATRISHLGRDWKTMDRVAQDTRYDFNHEERELNADEDVPETFTWTHAREMFSESIADPEWPRYKLHVNVAPRTTRAFLVGKPVARADGLVGPGTRCYVAFDCEERHFVWLKDSWRAAYELVQTEGDILSCLNNAGVENVPTLACHGDVRKQVTLTAQWWVAQNPKSPTPAPRSTMPSACPPTRRTRANVRDEKTLGSSSDPSDDQNPSEPDFRPDCPIRQLTHYRLATKEVMMPLARFENGQQLVFIITDSLDAHGQALDKPIPGRLHRDINDRSILIYPRVITSEDKATRSVKWGGILANWELSKAMVKGADRDSVGARQPERAGSWQFMSVNLLSRLGRVTVADDIESLVLVLIYHAVRYLNSNIAENLSVAKFLEDCFDCYTVGAKKVLCGERKTIVVKTGELVYFQPGEGLAIVEFDSPLDKLLATVLRWFSLHYKVVAWDAYIARHPTLARAQSLLQTPMKPSRPHFDVNPFPRRDGDEGAKPKEKIKPPPTSEERDLASRVVDHATMKETFLIAAGSSGWSGVDRHEDGDRVPPGWESSLDPIPALATKDMAFNPRYVLARTVNYSKFQSELV